MFWMPSHLGPRGRPGRVQGFQNQAAWRETFQNPDASGQRFPEEGRQADDAVRKGVAKNTSQ